MNELDNAIENSMSDLIKTMKESFEEAGYGVTCTEGLQVVFLNLMKLVQSGASVVGSVETAPEEGIKELLHYISTQLFNSMLLLSSLKKGDLITSSDIVELFN